MNIRQLVIASGLTICSLTRFAGADEGQYVQENGILYYDTYRTVQRAVTETALQQTTRTVYKEQLNTETRDVTRTTWTPVTVYRAQAEMVGKWNFFIEPYWETRWVTETQWMPRTEVVKMPVTCRKLVPETQNVQVPVTTQKIVCERIRVSRVPVSGAPPNSTIAPTLAGGPVARPTPNPQNAPVPTPIQRYQPGQLGGQIGGVARLNQDPPRYSTTPGVPPATR